MNKKIDFKKTLKSDSLGLPFTPSHWVGTPEYIPVTRIRMTCGGGVGGSSWYEYVNRIMIDDVIDSKFIKVTDYTGNEITINTNYIVEMRNFTILKAVFMNSGNYHFEPGSWEYYTLMEGNGHEVELID